MIDYRAPFLALQSAPWMTRSDVRHEREVGLRNRDTATSTDNAIEPIFVSLGYLGGKMGAVHYHSGRFPPDDRLDWPKLVPHIGPATAAVARYDGMLAAVPNPRVLLAPLSTREAVLSSRIEGTQATMGEVLEFEAGHKPASPARRDDISEVINYRAAMSRAEEMLEKLPLCLRVSPRSAFSITSRCAWRRESSRGIQEDPNWIGPQVVA